MRVALTSAATGAHRVNEDFIGAVPSTGTDEYRRVLAELRANRNGPGGFLGRQG